MLNAWVRTIPPTATLVVAFSVLACFTTTAVAADSLTVTVTAANANTDIATRGLVWAPVESVSLPSSGTPTLKVVGVGDIKPGDVRSAA